MKAIVQKKYGGPEVLHLADVEQPTPKDGEVLVKVRATAINDYDWSLMRGKPYIYRLMFGLTKPKSLIPGMELSGTIEACGEKATKFAVGTDVYGDISACGFGTFAEYVCVKEQELHAKPSQMSFDDAASIPHAALLAVQGLIDVGDIQPGNNILINGAGGGMGTFGLYIAKTYGATVTGVDTGQKLEMMSSIGFDYVIDYKTEDFTKNGQRYDLILDAKTNRAPLAYVESLVENGKYVTVGGDLNRLLQLLMMKWWVSRVHKKSMAIVALKPNKDLDYINDLYAAGKIKTTIDGPYSLKEVPKLIQYFGEGRHVGKIIVNP